MAEEKVEYTVYRVGICSKCGYCCKKTCEHFDVETNLCEIHDDKPDICREAPEFPMRQANPKCGYMFKIKERPDLEVIDMICTKVSPGKTVGLSGVAYIKAGAMFKGK